MLTSRIVVVRQVDLAVSAQKLPELMLRAENLLDVAGVGELGLDVLFVIYPVYSRSATKNLTWVVLLLHLQLAGKN